MNKIYFLKINKNMSMTIIITSVKSLNNQLELVDFSSELEVEENGSIDTSINCGFESLTLINCGFESVSSINKSVLIFVNFTTSGSGMSIFEVI